MLVNRPESLDFRMRDWPLEVKPRCISQGSFNILVTHREHFIAMFEEYDGKTKLTLKHSDIGGISATDLDNMQHGWSQSFDKLSEYPKNLAFKT